MTQAEQIYLKHFNSLDREILYETGDETKILAAIQEALDAGELKGFSKGIDSANKVEKEIADWTNVVELRKELAAKEKELQELREALENLVQLKRWKDKHGKDEHYARNVDAAWQKAFELIPEPPKQ